MALGLLQLVVGWHLGKLLGVVGADWFGPGVVAWLLGHSSGGGDVLADHEPD